jgi:[protein-PII] uridylyltransferase
MDRTPEFVEPSATPGGHAHLRIQESPAWRVAKESFFTSGNTEVARATISAMVQRAVVGAYETALLSVKGPAIALVAPGIFGRGELFPYSEVEVLVLFDAEAPSPALKERLAEFARLLWEQGLRLNHSARPLGEALEVREKSLDFTLALLDQRLLAGDAELHAKFAAGLGPLFAKHATRLIGHACEKAREWHLRYAGTPFHLEPDVRDAPGGLRDFELLRQLRTLSPDRYSPSDAPAVSATTAAMLRCFLHFQRGGDHNVFDYSAQAAIASLGLAAGRDGGAVMRDYLGQAEAVHVAVSRELDSWERMSSPPSADLDNTSARLSNAEFTILRERILLRNPERLETDAGLALRLFEFVARHAIPLAAETELCVESTRGSLSAVLSSSGPLWSALRGPFGLPNVGLALRTFKRTGLLKLILPELAGQEHLAVPDSARRFTSEEETLRSVEAVDQLRGATEASAQRFAQLLSELDQPALLPFALLFANSGAGAAEPLSRSLELVREAAARLGMSAEEQVTVEFLVRHQADFAEVTKGRDLGDPATARALAERAATVEHLKQLAMLTFARNSVLKPDSGTAWRVEQIWRAYLAVQHELTRGLETDRIQDVPADLGLRSAFLVGFPVRYVRAHSRAEIRSHIDLYDVSRSTGVGVLLERIEGAWRLTVVAGDRPALFASFAGAISSFGLDILKAEAFSNSTGVILDTFLFADPKQALERNPTEVDRLRDLVRRVALGKTDAQRLLRNRIPATEGQSRSVTPHVLFDSEASETATLVEIDTADRVGLLYSLASVFSSNGCNIEVVLIDTKGHRAIDIFYVSYQGRKLAEEMQAILREKLIAAA